MLLALIKLKGVNMPNDTIMKVEIEDYILYDRINDLAVQYATSTDCLMNLAIKRLINDMEFYKDLRAGAASVILRQDVQK